MVKQFTDFTDLGAAQADDLIVGTRGNVNVQINFNTGIKDQWGSYFFEYASPGNLATNHLKFVNAVSGSKAILTASGTDSNIGISLTPKGEGDADIETSGLGNINLNTASGKIYFNGTDPLEGFTTDSTFMSASNLYAPSALAVKTYFDNSIDALANLTYITDTDETADLPNSFQLLGTSNEINVNNGVLSLPNSLLLPGSLQVNGDLEMASGGFMFSTADLQFIAAIGGGAGDLSLLVNGTGDASIQTDSGDITLETSSGVQNFIIGASSIFDLSVSGARFGGTGARITNISTDGTLSANSDTLLITEKASKTYIDGTQTIIKAKTYITNTNETASLPNSQPLALLSTGIVSVTTSTGILSSSILTGTSSQIDVSNGTGIGGNPTFSLSSTLVTPGTFAVGMGGVTVTTISNSATATGDVLMSADAIQTAISSQVGSAKSFRGGYDASSNLFPTTGGSGGGGAVQAGDVWSITVAGTLGGTAVSNGDTILALVSTPGQTAANWSINSNGVATWNGRAGIVTPQSGDYSFGLISGTAAATQGGTGQTTYTIGDLLYASSTSALSKLAAVATGNVLLSGGVATAPSWGKVDLTAAVTGVLPTANGGTGNGSGQAASVANAATFNNSGSGAASGTTFDGSAARTISYNTVGASPLAGSSSLTTVGTISSGTWQGTAISEVYGGTNQTSYTKGDLLHASAANTLSKLGIGSTGQMLSVVSGDTAWSTPTYANTYAVNTLLYAASSNAVSGLATANSSLLSTNGSGVPGWNSITQYNVLSAGASGAINNIAPSTAGYVLMSNGASAQPTFQPPFIPASYGTLRWANGETGGAFVFTGTPAEMNNIASISYAISGTANDFSLSSTGRLQYTGATPKKFVVRAGLAWAELAYAVHIQIYKNGSPIGNDTYIAGGLNTSPAYVITMAQNDYISIYGWRLAVALTIVSAWISATEFST